MATQTPDPRSLDSWEDAFQYQVPEVLKLEQRLRSTATENREKLRTLVGAGYRNLLGTAERIVEMDQDMQQVDSTLGRMGQKCNSRIVDDIVNNFTKYDKSRKSKDQERFAFTAQLAMLQNCPILIYRILQKNGSCYVAAKILVISRLLHKTLSQAPDPSPILDNMRKELTSVRRRLLRRIDKELTSMESNAVDLIKAMCAFSLATSSTPTDVLRHYHHVRMKTIAAQFQQDGNPQNRILKALQIYVRTLQDTQKIFPGQFAEALAKLKRNPLILDDELQDLPELNFTIHLRWISDEAKNYTPWPRHDQLQKQEAEKILRAWAKLALDNVISGLRNVLGHISNLEDLSGLRRQMLAGWAISSNRVLGLDSSHVLDDLREVLNLRLKTIIIDHTRKLTTVSDHVSTILDSWSYPMNNRGIGLWSDNVVSFEIGDGAPGFKTAVVNQSRGKNEPVNETIAVYDNWERTVVDANKVIKAMKDIRWDDDINDDIDDEFGLDSKQELLSEDDPLLLEETIQEGLGDAFQTLQAALKNTISQVIGNSGSQKSEKVIFLLRILREISQRLLKLRIHFGSLIVTQIQFDSNLIESLHWTLATSISDDPLQTYRNSLIKFSSSKRIVARTLWEGNPPLPTQPSPTTFLFLHQLTKLMGNAGIDLWTPGATALIKRHLFELIPTLFSDCTQKISCPATENTGVENIDNNENGDAITTKTGSTSLNIETSRDKKVQLYFDMMFLRRAFSKPIRTGEDDSYQLLIKSFSDDLQIEEGAYDRLAKQAADYWKRTYLLFALLM